MIARLAPIARNRNHWGGADFERESARSFDSRAERPNSNSPSDSVFRRSALAGRVAALRGWRRHGLAVLLGALAALALPPFHVVPLLMVALVGLVWLLDGLRRPLRGGFAVGWWFALGFFSLGQYWIANALLIDAAAFGWMVPFAVFGLSAFLALIPGAATAVAGLLWRPGHPARVLLLAVLWLGAEWLRQWVATGFPWNMAATVWTPWPAMLQVTSVIGALGLGGLTVAALAAPAVLADSTRPRIKGVVMAVAVLALAAPAGWGAWRLATVDPGPGPGVTVRLVQPNLSQGEKMDGALRDVALMDHIAMSRRAGFEAVDIVVWPETAVGFPLNLDAQRRAMASEAAPTDGVLITGAPRLLPETADQPLRFWNSLFILRPNGAIVDIYDKAHLVPFGEYVPFGDLLPVQKVTPGRVDFSFGDGIRTLRGAGLPPVSPLICYEVIFPGTVVDAADRPAWMVNITNDGWYGISPGPYQHFATARMRAVEEGLPLVRVANTGISAVVDALGRVQARLELGTRGVVDAPLPGALAPTPFARLGAAPTLTGALVLGGLALVAMRRRSGPATPGRAAPTHG